MHDVLWFTLEIKNMFSYSGGTKSFHLVVTRTRDMFIATHTYGLYKTCIPHSTLYEYAAESNPSLHP